MANSRGRISNKSSSSESGRDGWSGISSKVKLVLWVELVEWVELVVWVVITCRSRGSDSTCSSVNVSGVGPARGSTSLCIGKVEYNHKLLANTRTHCWYTI